MNQQELESLIMNGFRVGNSRPGHCLDKRWLQNQIYDKLNPKEQQLVNGAITQLEKDGFIQTHDNKNGLGWCMELTQKGYEDIYPIVVTDVIDEIGNAILTKFAAQKSKIGHIIQTRWINQTLLPKLNPRKRELINQAIDKLIQNKMITVDTEGEIIQALKLEQAGFDFIYS